MKTKKLVSKQSFAIITVHKSQMLTWGWQVSCIALALEFCYAEFSVLIVLLGKMSLHHEPVSQTLQLAASMLYTVVYFLTLGFIHVSFSLSNSPPCFVLCFYLSFNRTSACVLVVKQPTNLQRLYWHNAAGFKGSLPVSSEAACCSSSRAWSSFSLYTTQAETLLK